LVANLRAWVDDLPHGEKVVGRLWLARAEAGARPAPVEVDHVVSQASSSSIAGLVRHVMTGAVLDRYRFFPDDVWEEAQAPAGQVRPAGVDERDVDAFADRLERVAAGMAGDARREVLVLGVAGAAPWDRARWRVAAGVGSTREAEVVALLGGADGADPRGDHGAG
jgi:hypothetical protein